MTPLQRLLFFSGRRWTPLRLPGLNVWLSSGRGLYQLSTLTPAAVADADPVGAWADRGPSGRHVIQATTTKRFSLKKSLQNGRDALRPDGIDDELANAAFGGLSFDQLSVYVAATGTTPAATASIVRLRDTAAGDIFSLFQVTATNKIRAQYATSGGNQFIDTAAAYTSPFVACVTIDASSNYTFRVNGTELTGTFAGTKVVRAVDMMNLGAASGGNPFGGDYYEVAVCNVAHDRATMLRAESYFRNWLNV